MYHHFNFSNTDSGLPILAGHLLHRAPELPSRNGATRELAQVGITMLRPLEREVTLPVRRASIAAQIAETMWVLAGRDDVAFIEEYLPRAPQFSDDGKVWRGAYGKRLRSWPRRGSHFDVVDQLRWVIDLLNEDPHTRRAVMAIYDPDRDSQDGLDIPCNDFLTFLGRNGELDMSVTVRSNDLVWGWSGINVFEWSTLLEVVAALTGFKVGKLHFNTTSLHLYEHHYERAQHIAQDSPVVEAESKVRPIKDSPRFSVTDPDEFDHLITDWFNVENVIRAGNTHNTTRYVEEFPDPMMQSWLRVLQWWWTADSRYLAPLERTRLWCAAKASVQPKKPQSAKGLFLGTEYQRPTTTTHYAVDENGAHQLVPATTSELEDEEDEGPSDFLKYAFSIHRQKHADYGQSWKKRGEQMSIMANIARKVDRLGANSVEETSADTALDLLVYLAKYRVWLYENVGDRGKRSFPVQTWPEKPSDHVGPVHGVLQYFEDEAGSSLHYDAHRLEEIISVQFEQLERHVTEGKWTRISVVNQMLITAYRLARVLWESEDVVHPISQTEAIDGADIY